VRNGLTPTGNTTLERVRVYGPCCHHRRSQHLRCKTTKVFIQDEELLNFSNEGTCLSSLAVLDFSLYLLLPLNGHAIFNDATYPTSASTEKDNRKNA